MSHLLFTDFFTLNRLVNALDTMTEKRASLEVKPVGEKDTSPTFIEKVPLEDVNEVSSDDEGPRPIKDWTDAEETRVRRKLDCIIIPLLIMGFVALQWDRGNMGNAMTDFLLQDVKISQEEFNLGQTLLALSVVLFEIPNNLCFFRFGPRIWLTGQMFCWGSAAILQCLYKGKGFGPYVCLRIFLGLAEAGYSGSGLYTMTVWYKRNETSKRFAIFYVGNTVAHAVGGLMATGVLHMRGICGLTGWQWLFLISGGFTIVASIIFGCFLPENPDHPLPLTGIQYFTPREKEILKKRVLLDDPTKFRPRRHITFGEMKSTFTDWRFLTHVLITIAGHAPSSTMSSYAPTLVKGFGFERIKANAITSIGHWGLACNLIIWGFTADKLRKRGPMVSLGLTLWCCFAYGCLAASYHHARIMRLVILLFGLSFSTCWHPTNASWVSLNAQNPGERSVRMAMMTVSLNAASMMGNQFFQARDKPRYHRGWTVIAALLTVAVVLSVFCNLQYWYLNRRLNKKAQREDGPAQTLEEVEKRAWRWSP